MENIEIIKCFCLWQDLLGYGNAFYQSNWDLTQPCAQKNLMRIKNLEDELTRSSLPMLEKVLLLNDGMIKTADIRPLRTWDYVEFYTTWLEDAIKQYYRINSKDKQQGHPGIRGVLTVGDRAEYTKELVKISQFVQGWNDSNNDSIVVYAPSEFQMNTAFSKACIIESSGSKAGLKGSFLFIDKEFIDYFVYMINTSGWTNLTKVDNDYVDGQPVTTTSMKIKYSAELKEIHDIRVLYIYVKSHDDAEPIEYKKILFDKQPIPYKEKSKSLATELFKTIGFWSIDDGVTIDLNSDDLNK